MKITVKKTTKNASLKVPLPGDGSPAAIAKAIVDITLLRQSKLFETELAEAEEFEKENGIPGAGDSGLKMPSATDLVNRTHTLRTEAIKLTVAPAVLELPFESLVMLYVYLCGMEEAVTPIGRIVQGVAEKLNPDSVMVALIAEMNNIEPSDVMAALFANQPVEPGQKVTVQMSKVPEDVREDIVAGFEA